jgi:hypothetical protein
MKKIVAMLCAVALSSTAVAAVKCEPSPRGGMCCWDTKVDGPFRPLSC